MEDGQLGLVTSVSLLNGEKVQPLGLKGLYHFLLSVLSHVKKLL